MKKCEKGGNSVHQEYETVIGLEVHVELATKSKIFCGCATQFGSAPNTQVCPVCIGMPGSLPVLNKKVIEYAVTVGMATNCKIAQYCKFDRKNYFYPDNPQNYQISQLYMPICSNGAIEIETAFGKKIIRIHEIHMEEDAGKLVHEEAEKCSLIDYNRAGIPLIEIVSEPDMRNAEEVISYLEKLRFLIQYLGVSDCKLQEGSMRVDVNLSVHETETLELGTRTEMKNLNSFREIAKAIAHEKARQISLLKEGKAVIQETRRWDEKKECSVTMRSKEEARDYRYFPEPDLPPIVISERWLEKIKSSQPELRDEKRARYKIEYDIPEYDINIITESRDMAELFEDTTAICNNPKKVSNWLMVETLRILKERELEASAIGYAAENLAKLIMLTENKIINSTVAKEVFEKMFDENIDPEVYVEEKQLGTVTDQKTLRENVLRIMTENPQSVEDYRKGKEKAILFLVGQTMKSMKGQADPKIVQFLLEELLSQEIQLESSEIVS